MPMKISSQTHYSISLPDDWNVEPEEDYTCFYHPDGVGDLLISSFENEQDVTDEDLQEFASDHLDSDSDSDPENVEYGDFNGFSFCYEVDNDYVCEWYLKASNIMLFITYSCALADEEKSEEDIVENILGSLQLRKYQ